MEWPSLPALFDKEFDGRDLTLGDVLAKTAEYTRYYITYKSGELTISGIMNVPNGDGPFPVLILNHGHIDTAVYTNSRGTQARAGLLCPQWLCRHPSGLSQPCRVG